LLKLSTRLKELTTWLLTLGPLGVFAIALLDSAFVPLPSGPDLAVIAMSAIRPGAMILYAVAATAGSTAGCIVLYSIARKAGEKVLSKVPRDRRDRIENLLGRYDVLALIVPAMLPPPFPFKLFILSAGVFKLRMSRFVLAVFAGRLARFMIEGWLAVRYGEEAWLLILRHGWKFLIGVVAAVGAWLIIRFLRQRSIKSEEAGQA
ncbi:MAG TPA: VTT domain-containing protein, partial [Blastocatellia bacterium]|nr:VTT domain-containing protein [Blastocatellia bacterium]